MVCFDTTFLIDLFDRKGEPNLSAKRKLRGCKENKQRISTTYVSVCELLKDVYKFQNPKVRINEYWKLLNKFEILGFNQKVCEIYAEINKSLIEQQIDLEEIEKLNASMSLGNNERIFITRNIKHYQRIKGLKIEGY